MSDILIEKMARVLAKADGCQHFDNLAPRGFFAQPRFTGKDYWFSQARAALSSIPVLIEALEWFGTQRNLQLYFYGPVYCDDDDQAREWRIDKESGSINDREWTTVGRGPSPIEAINDARQALTSTLDASPANMDDGGGA